MADNDVSIKIKTTADNSDAEKTEKSLRRIGQAAKDAEKGSGGLTNALKGTITYLNGVRSAIGKVIAATGLIGMAVNGVQTLITAFKSLKEWLDKDKTAAEELAKKIQDAKNVKAIEDSSNAYDTLNRKIADTLKLEQERDKLAGQRKESERDQEDALSELAMQKELAAVDGQDPDAQYKARLIRGKYARLKSQRDADRASRDLAERQGKLMSDADEKDAQATEFENYVNGKGADAVVDLKNQIARKAGAVNSEWRRNGKSEAYDRLREELARLMQQRDALVGQNQKKMEAATQLRANAESMRKEAANLLGTDSAAIIRNRAVNVALDAEDKETRRLMREAQDRRAREAKEKEEKKASAAAERERLTASVTSGESMSANLRRQIAFHQRRYGAAEETQARAGFNLQTVDGTGLKAAQEAKYQADRTVAQINGVLGELTAKLKAVEEGLKRDRSRLASAKEEL